METTRRLQRNRPKTFGTFASNRDGTAPGIWASSLEMLSTFIKSRGTSIWFKPGVKWEGAQPPRPTFWMHQLEGVDPNLLLCVNPTRLSEEVGKLIAQSN